MHIHRRQFVQISLCALALATMGSRAWAAVPSDILVVGKRLDDLVTLDPGESFEGGASEVARNVYRRLVNYDPANLEAGYGPDIAESWSVSEDGLTITLVIREGLKFDSGNPVRAEDAEFSLRRAVQMNKAPAFILTQFGFSPDNVEQTIVADGKTLKLTTDKRYADSLVLNCLTATVGSILDKELVLSHATADDFGNGWLRTNSAGSGPYKVNAWRANEAIILDAASNWQGEAVSVQRIMIRHVAESATQRLLLEKGDIDIARNLNPEDVQAVEVMDGIRVVSELRGRLMYIALNQKHPTLADPRIREAIKYLIDYKGMEASFLKGAWTVHQNIVPASFLGAVTDAPFIFDMERAKRLIAEVGAPAAPIQIGVRAGQEYMDIAQTIQNAMNAAGLPVEIMVGAASQISSLYRARKLDIYLGSWGPDYPDPHTNAGSFAYNPDNSDDAEATGAVAWRNAWDTEGLSALVEAAARENDIEKRREMYSDIQAKFRENAPIAVLFQQTEQAAMREQVEGLSLGGALSHPAYWRVTK